MRAQLFLTVRRASDVRSKDPLDADEAEDIGAALAALHHSSSETLGWTLEVLTAEILGEQAPEAVVTLLPRLMHCLGRMAAGFGLSTDHMMWRVQDEKRLVLDSDLCEAHVALQAAFRKVEAWAQLRKA